MVVPGAVVCSQNNGYDVMHWQASRGCSILMLALDKHEQPCEQLEEATSNSVQSCECSSEKGRCRKGTSSQEVSKSVNFAKNVVVCC